MPAAHSRPCTPTANPRPRTWLRGSCTVTSWPSFQDTRPLPRLVEVSTTFWGRMNSSTWSRVRGAGAGLPWWAAGNGGAAGVVQRALARASAATPMFPAQLCGIFGICWHKSQ